MLTPAITLLPEFHLTGFSPEKAITLSQAAEIVSPLPGYVVVAGYVEEDGNSFYSSAIVVERGGSIRNICKSEPWGRTEKKRLTRSHCAYPIVNYEDWGGTD